MDEKETSDSNLPVLAPESISIPDYQEVTPPQKLNEAIKPIVEADLKLANMAVQAVHQGWSSVETLSQLTRMIKNTIDVVKFRRDVLCVPYGYQGKTSKRDDEIVVPYD